MPVESMGDYVPMMVQVGTHWGAVNAAVTPALTVVVDAGLGVDLAAFTALRGALEVSQVEVINRQNDVELARGDIRLTKGVLRGRLRTFCDHVEAFYQGTAIGAVRPKMPGETEGQERTVRALVEMATLWEVINERPAPPGQTLPLVLDEAVTVAAFSTGVAELVALYRAERRALKHLELARADRDVLLARAYLVMKGYRQAVLARCAGHPALLTSVPDLSPRPGHTPKPVAAAAVYVPPGQARVTYEASPEKTLARYQLRGHAGEVYKADEARVLATHGPEAAREFLVGPGLALPGAPLVMKLFVMLKTGNEAGGEALVVRADAAG